ncbi:UNVERIFIED_CONTAM: hypothetical protein FKN15_058860 [Acipenser sinensis]
MEGVGQAVYARPCRWQRGLVRRFMPNLANGKAPLLPFEAGEAGFLIHLRRWYGLQVDPLLRSLHLTSIKGLHKEGVFIWAHFREVPILQAGKAPHSPSFL